MNKEYLAKKIFFALITVLAVLIINFFLFRIMPGDPLSMVMRNPKASESAIAKTRALFGLDQSIFVQFGVYIKQLFSADLGLSFIYKKPVFNVIFSKVGATLFLLGISEVIAILAGVSIGIFAAQKRGKAVDVISLSFSLFLYSIPTFLLGIIFILFFSVYLGIFPTSGISTPGLKLSSFWIWIKDLSSHAFLPSLTLSLTLIGEYAILMRTSLLETLTEDYIITARAKGLKENEIIRKHAIPNAMLPVITSIAINLGFIIAGAIQVETVFSWPGIGRLMYDALNNRDYPLLQGIFLLVTISVVTANFLSDIIYMYLDPRIKVL